MWIMYNSHFLASQENIAQWRVLFWESFGEIIDQMEHIAY